MYTQVFPNSFRILFLSSLTVCIIKINSLKCKKSWDCFKKCTDHTGTSLFHGKLSFMLHKQTKSSSLVFPGRRGGGLQINNFLILCMTFCLLMSLINKSCREYYILGMPQPINCHLSARLCASTTVISEPINCKQQNLKVPPTIGI